MPGDGGTTAVHESALAGGHQVYRVAVPVVAALLAGYLLWLVLDLGSASVRNGVAHVVAVGVPLVAAGACWRAHRLRAGRHTAWWWLAVACGTWSAGALSRAVLAVGTHAAGSFPSLADVGQLGFAVPATLAMLRFPRSGGRTLARWRLTLDGVVIAGCLLATSAIWALDPVLESASSPGVQGWALAYPFVDACLAAFVLARSTVFPIQRRRVWLLLSAAFVTLMVTDALYVAGTFRDDHLPGGPLDVGWALAFALVALAAVAPVVDPAKPAPAVGEMPTTMYEQLVPYGAITMVLVAVAENPAILSAGSVHRWLLVPLLALVALRQLVVVADHTTLARTLADTVERRTGELIREQQWWREVVQNLSDVVVVVDEDLRIRYCSPSADHVLGSWPQQVPSSPGAGAAGSWSVVSAAPTVAGGGSR